MQFYLGMVLGLIIGVCLNAFLTEVARNLPGEGEDGQEVRGKKGYVFEPDPNTDWAKILPGEE